MGHRRRAFLQGLVGLAAAGCAPGGAEVAHAHGPARALVGAGAGRGALAEAIEAAGGLGFLARGDAVVVKVNLNSGNAYPYTTSPELAAELARLLRDRGAGRVVFADRSFFGADTRENARRTGLAEAVTRAGAEWLVLDERDPALAWIEVPEREAPDWRGGLRVPRLFREAHVIHLAQVKTHFISHFTMSLKLAFGAVHADDRRRNLSPHDTRGGRLWRQIAQAAASYRPRLHLLDARRPVITGGPDDGEVAGGWSSVLASTDPIALDVTGLAVLAAAGSPEPAIAGTPIWKQPQIAAAQALGLGIDAPDRYAIAGRVPDAVRRALGA